jgi:ABC-type Fe3+-hydroxamate transport system substrate-binding protein
MLHAASALSATALAAISPSATGRPAPSPIVHAATGRKATVPEANARRVVVLMATSHLASAGHVPRAMNVRAQEHSTASSVPNAPEAENHQANAPMATSRLAQNPLADLLAADPLANPSAASLPARAFPASRAARVAVAAVLRVGHREAVLGARGVNAQCE